MAVTWFWWIGFTDSFSESQAGLWSDERKNARQSLKLTVLFADQDPSEDWHREHRAKASPLLVVKGSLVNFQQTTK